MKIEFATCERNTALRFLQQALPDKNITDTPESAGPLLDFVERDLVRVQDPMMYGNSIAIVPGRKWVEDADVRKQITDACAVLQA